MHAYSEPFKATIVFLTVALPSLAFFSCIAVAIWLVSRRREREAYYQNETIKRLSESPEGSSSALEYLREKDKIAKERHQRGLRLGGLIVVAVGMAVMIFMHMDDPKDPDYFSGMFPILIGAAMLIYSYFLAPKE